MKIKVFMRQGGFAEFDNINDYAYDSQDNCFDLYSNVETLVTIPRECILFIQEEHEYDKNRTN